jgi:3-methyladenine DNA glycosylase AlkD
MPGMTLQDVLAQLETMGDAKVRALNVRNGAGEDHFGVKLGDLRILAKKIKPNPPLARELWETGNADARLLATLLMRPKELSPDELDRLVRSVTYSQLADWLTAYVVNQHPDKETLRLKWMESHDPMSARAGWSLTSDRVSKSAEGLDLDRLLDRIDAEMGGAHPTVQWTMNFSLAMIGIHHPAHRERAIAIGERLGVFRDYPTSKGCTSPFAPIWIAEMVRRQG